MSSAGALMMLALALLMTFGCDEQASRPQREPEPLASMELARSKEGVGANERLPTIWITDEAVVFGSRRLTTITKGRLANTSEGDVIGRALKRAEAARRGYGLGVDRRAQFRLAREVMAAGLKAGANAVELRVGGVQTAKALKVCAASSLSETQGSPDCWRRSIQRPPRGGADTGPRDGGGTDMSGDGSPLVGDIQSSPPSYRWDAPLDLTLSIEERYLLVKVQGRSFRTVPLKGPSGEARSETLRLLSQTLQSFRQANSWERRAGVRAADGVGWELIIDVLNALEEARFDVITLGDISLEQQ